MNGRRRLFAWAGGLLATLCLATAAVSEQVLERAEFVVTDKVVASDVGPFTATIGAVGNGHALMPNGGFEPLVLRSMFPVKETVANGVVAAPGDLSGQDTWREGALDGAEVEILRIENGAFRSVRRDRVAPGGHRASGWIRMFGGSVLPPEAGNARFALPPWYRPGTLYHFTLKSVSSTGDMSAPAPFVSVRLPDTLPRSRRPEDLILFKTVSGGNSALSPPSGLQAAVTEQGEVELSWRPVAGASGYALFRSDQPAEAHRGYALDLAGNGPEIRAGDLAILRTRFYRSDRNRLLTNRVWNAGATKRSLLPRLLTRWSDEPGAQWHLAPHPEDSPVPEAGETHLRVTLAAGERFTLGMANHSGTAQSWYPVLEPGRTYRFDVWMRGRTLQTVRFELTGFHAGKNGGFVRPIPFRVTPDWRRYSAQFTVPVLHPGKAAGQMQIVLNGPGEFDIESFRVHRDDAPYLAFLPEDGQRLAESGMAMLRTHGFIKTGHRSYDLAQLTNAGGQISAMGGGNTLPQVLSEIASLGADPWLQIEPHLSEEEWLGLVEYLVAEFDPMQDDATRLPWAAKRLTQGQAAPWGEQFEQIALEIGNETWNRLFAPWVFQPMEDAATGRRYSAGEVYGLYQEYVLSILRKSPHWPKLAPKLLPIIGGHAASDYGTQAARVSPNTAVLSQAGYIGGWEQKAGPATPDAKGLSRVLTHVLQVGAPRAIQLANRATEIGRERGTTLAAGTYEAGPGYVVDGLNGRKISTEEAALQRRAMKSAAAGTATLDSFLAGAESGLNLQNYFIYGERAHWASHLPWHEGGVTLPSWELLALFNLIGTGDMLAVEAVSVPQANLEKSRGRPALSRAPLVHAYVTRSGSRLTLFLVSRRVPGPSESGATEVSVSLPFQSAERVARYHFEGVWNAGPLDGAQLPLVSEQVPAEAALPRLHVPELGPGRTEIYVFDGVR